MDIGSAKPSHGDRQKWFIRGIDLVDVNKIFSVAEYSMYAKNVIERSLNKNVPIVVTGRKRFLFAVFFVTLWWMRSKFQRKFVIG